MRASRPKLRAPSCHRLVVAALLAAAAGGGCRDGHRPDVLLITLDTVRADHFGCYGSATAVTPNVDRLAAAGVLYERCVSPVPITLPAHASILTGRYPNHHGARLNGDRLAQGERTLAEILAERGWDTAAFVSAEVVRARWGLDQGFAVYDDRLPDRGLAWAGERVAEHTVAAAVDWLDRRRSRPYFAWVHLFDPHQPYAPPDGWTPRVADDPYADEIAYADHALGRLLDRIDPGRTLVVLAGDHGESLGEHGEATHSLFTYSATLHVPLIVVPPGRPAAGRRIAAPVSLIDVLPTILSALDLPLLDGLDGVGLPVAVDSPAAGRALYFESVAPLEFGWVPLAGLRTADWHFIAAPRPELYRVADDPGETDNRIDAQPDEARALAEQLAAMDPFGGLADDAADRRLSASDRRRLAALGYLGGDLAVPAGGLDALPDAKDRIAVHGRLLDADLAGRDGNLDEAIAALEAILAEAPELGRARLLLASFLAERGDRERAIAEFDRLVAEPGTDAEAWRLYALLLIEGSDFERAVSVVRHGLDRHPDEAALWDVAGVAYRLAGRPALAADCARRAAGLASDDAVILANLGAAELQADDLAAAQRTFERLLDVEPTYVDGALELTRVLILRGRFERAAATAERALELRPGDADARYLRGLAFKYDHRSTAAETDFRAVLASHPDYAPAYERLAELLLDARPPRVAEAVALVGEARARSVALAPEVTARVAAASGN